MHITNTVILLYILSTHCISHKHSATVVHTSDITKNVSKTNVNDKVLMEYMVITSDSKFKGHETLDSISTG